VRDDDNQVVLPLVTVNPCASGSRCASLFHVVLFSTLRLRDSHSAPLIGYMRVSKADGSQLLDLQRDALLRAGVSERQLYNDTASGKQDDRPGLAACLQALREGDTLVVWKLDRLGRSLKHLVNVVHDLTSRGVSLKVLTGQGAAIDTTTSAGKLVFGIFASLAEFERDLISDRTRAGLASARARGRKGGRKPKMTPAKRGSPLRQWVSLRRTWRISAGNWE
jgi:DNA invertase Pin-like site-specific DNA recombinase